MKKVLFVCVHNSGRSQMAEAFANKYGEGILQTESAGTEPSEEMNSASVQAMEEIGYDMRGHYPKVITEEMKNSSDRIITMGCGVEVSTCPVFFKPTEDWGLEDPKDQALEKVREIRDEIKSRVENLIAEIAREDE